MSIEKGPHGYSIRFSLLESSRSNDSNDISDLKDFLGGVRKTAFFGFIKEPARIRAKINTNGSIYLETRTGSIFGIIYKKLTSRSTKAIFERELAKNYISSILKNKNFNVDAKILNNIEKILEDTKKEFNREELYNNLLTLVNIKESKNTDKDISESKLKFKTKELPPNNQENINNLNIHITNNKNDNNFNSCIEESSPNTQLDVYTEAINIETPPKKLNSNTDNKESTGNNKINIDNKNEKSETDSPLVVFSNNGRFDISENNSIGSKPKIERINADYYIAPFNYNFSNEVKIITNKNISENKYNEFNISYQFNDQNLINKCFIINGSIGELFKNGIITYKKLKEYQENLVNLYINLFTYILNSNKNTSNKSIKIAIIPFIYNTLEPHVVEIRAITIAINKIQNEKQNAINFHISTQSKAISDVIKEEFSNLNKIIH